MPAPEIIKKLVDQFSQNRESYRSGKYNEAQLRQEFLDPFFEALGWDVYNKNGYSLDYREVVIEDSLDIEGASKSPDYAFKIGKERKFYVEAKKPRVDIQYDIHPAYQLRRYAWNAHLPLSILTDFEELAVYNCKNRPNPTDSAATGRELFFKFSEYVDRWDELAAIFSKEAVLKGAFDRYADSSSGKKGTTEVDDAFLEDIESWRKLLAQNIALRNPQVTDERRLNFAVQMTIDRIIFLRICEDRGIEPDEQLKDLTKAPNIYPRLVELFKRADQKYNSGLFHFATEKGNDSPADTFTPNLVIDDKIFKEIFKGIYYPCEYIFKEIPVEILGQVYEQFLGKVIHLTTGHQARIEEKPEVRKAGGVYYTPRYIVDYIVANTVGKLLEGKTPAEAATLKIVDPACGSGSFLLGAYQYLLDWHEKWYLENDPEKWARGKEPPISQVVGGWRLTTRMKKDILVNNIHGVDIDAQAVEVTKLSLLLKVLEGETGQLSLGFERVLPDLGHNIQCGNSLIGEDYFAGRLVVEDEERRRVNPFDWPSAFPQVFAKGGFDAVIGNPPYIRIQAMREWAPEEVEFYKKEYKSASKGNYDIYVIFIEKGLAILNSKGLVGYILPSKFLSTDYGEEVRKLVAERKALKKLVDFGHFQIFDSATTYTNLLFLSGSREDKIEYLKVDDPSKLLESTSIFLVNSLNEKQWLFNEHSVDLLIEKIYKNSTQLVDLPARMGRGSSSGDDNVFILEIKNGEYFTKGGERIEIEPKLLRSPVFATDYNRYKFNQSTKNKIIFPYYVSKNEYKLIPEDVLRKEFPKGYKYLVSKKSILIKRKQSKEWYSFSAPRNLDVHENAHIFVPLLANKGLFTKAPDNKGDLCLMASGGFSITINTDIGISPLYILGLLNSTLLFWRLRMISNVFRGGWITCTKQFVETLPIRKIDLQKSTEKRNHDQIIALVSRMLELNKRTPATPQEQLELQRNIAATDRQIDTLVYQLYELTPEEIAIVEGENK